jgi:hypothetical protein
MKDFDLNACGVSEMNRQEMLNVDGGNIFKDAWNWICNAAEAAWDWICGAAEDVWEFMNKYGNTNGTTGGHRDFYAP